MASADAGRAGASRGLARQALKDFAAELVAAWGSWGPSLSPVGDEMAFLSDRNGTPQVWVQQIEAGIPPGEPRLVHVCDDPVVAVRWSADGRWLACSVADGGGVRTHVWVVRPDGSEARIVAGADGRHAELGPWTRSGHRVVVTMPGEQLDTSTRSYLADPADGDLTPLAAGQLISVLDLSVDEHLVIVQDGPRGHQFCVVVDRTADHDHPLLPYPATGATDRAIIRPAPAGDPQPFIAYLATDAGLPRRQLVAVPLGFAGGRGPAGALRSRDDAELDLLDADDSGRQLLLVWNVAGRSEVELFDTATGRSRPVAGVPGEVVHDAVLSRDGRTAVCTVEGPERPRELWRLQTEPLAWTRLTGAPDLPARRLVRPTLERFAGRDGLPLTGWLYRVPGRSEPGAAMLSLHGGPEAQERPTFSPQHQVMVAAGVAVFAPNIRGSSGFGRAFVHADDVHGRRDAFDDVESARDLLVERSVADPARIAVTGRSYGGYLTLAALAFTPGTFAAGVDICGMSDLHTFYRDTEPWIAAAAYSKYGHPVRDRALLRALSPLRYAVNIDVPLLVVHGELDTNVPIGEARQIVARLRALGRPVEFLELEGEGHDYRRADSRVRLVHTMIDFLGSRLGAAELSAASAPSAPTQPSAPSPAFPG